MTLILFFFLIFVKKFVILMKQYGRLRTQTTQHKQTGNENLRTLISEQIPMSWNGKICISSCLRIKFVVVWEFKLIIRRKYGQNLMSATMH